MSSKRMRTLFGAVAAAALAGAAAPVVAQTGRDGGVPTETGIRLALANRGFDWNWIGLIGLFGLAGLHRRPDYHDPI
jgi:hypothetical protein